MPIIQNVNNAQAATTITAALDASQTDVDVASATGFPDAPFAVLVGTELMLVTSKGSGLDWTVTREYGNTSAAAHDIDAPIAYKLTAEWFEWAASGAPLELWALEVDDPLTSLDDLTTYSGTWSIDTTLKVVPPNGTTQCRAFSDVALSHSMAYVVEVEMQIPASGFSSSSQHMRVGVGKVEGNRITTVGLRGDGYLYWEADATAAIESGLAYALPSAGTWVKVRQAVIGSRQVVYVDDVAIGELHYHGYTTLAAAGWFPYVVSYGGHTAKFRNLKCWTLNLGIAALGT